MGSILFVTGTDTGVGKTLLTAMLLAHFRSRGVRVFAMKPICSGSLSDVRLLSHLQDGELSRERMNLFHCREPVAPVAMPRNSRPRISMGKIVSEIRSIQSECDLLIVEGCGGVMVPVSNNWMIRDLIGALKCSVALVARNRLGAINHTLLSIESLRVTGVADCRVVMMNCKSASLATRTNARVLRNLIAPAKLFQIPFLGPKAVLIEAVKINAKRFKKTLALIAKITRF